MHDSWNWNAKQVLGYGENIANGDPGSSMKASGVGRTPRAHDSMAVAGAGARSTEAGGTASASGSSKLCRQGAARQLVDHQRDSSLQTYCRFQNMT